MIEIIPQYDELDRYVEFADQNQCGFEYNDFMFPEIVDNTELCTTILKTYQGLHREENVDTLHGAFYDVIHFSRDAKIRAIARERMRQSMEFAQTLHCRGVVFHTNIAREFIDTLGYKETWINYSQEIIEELLNAYPGIEIYFENMSDETPDLLLQLCEKLKDQKRFGVCLDVAHLSLGRAETSEWFQKLSPYVKHFHFNDNNLKIDEHLSMGDGKIDWTYIMELIEKYGLNSKSILLEVSDINKLTRSYQYLERLNK